MKNIIKVARIKGQKYIATVFHIIEKDSDGTPRLFRLVRDDEKVDVRSGKEQFEIMFARIGLQVRRH